MRITATQYAKTLFEVTAGKTEQEIDGVTENFFNVLLKNRQLKLVDKIIERFSEFYNVAQGIVEVKIVSREMLDDILLKKIEKFIIEKYSAKKVIMTNTLDESIKGGIILKIGDELMDASIARKLVELKNSLMA